MPMPTLSNIAAPIRISFTEICPCPLLPVTAAVIVPRLPKLRSAALCPTAAAARTPIGAAYPCGFSMNVGELNAGLNYVRDHGSSVATPARVKSRTLRVTIVIP